MLGVAVAPTLAGVVLGVLATTLRGAGGVDPGVAVRS